MTDESAAGRVLSEAAARELVAQLRSGYAAGVRVAGLQIQLTNGQASPAIIGTASIPTATQAVAGAMTAADKAKLDGIATGATKVSVDASLSATSTNPVQNKAVNSALAARAPIASPTLTGTPKAPTAAAGTNSTQIATTAFVTSAVNAAITASVSYQGAANAYSDVTSKAYKPGWYWFIRTAGTYAGQLCEAGDMIIANAAKGAAPKDSDFDVIQSNVDYVTADDVKAWFA